MIELYFRRWLEVGMGDGGPGTGMEPLKSRPETLTTAIETPGHDSLERPPTKNNRFMMKNKMKGKMKKNK